MAIRGSYSKSYIPKGGGGKQLPIKVKSNKVTAPQINPVSIGGNQPIPTPSNARPQTKGAMPRVPGYFGTGNVY